MEIVVILVALVACHLLEEYSYIVDCVTCHAQVVSLIYPFFFNLIRVITFTICVLLG